MRIMSSIITVLLTCNILAQSSQVSLDFEIDELPVGISLVTGGVSTNDASVSYIDSIVTEATDADKYGGMRAMQMANAGYVKIDKSLLNKEEFTISFWTKWLDTGNGDGADPRDAAIPYAGFIDLKGMNGESPLVIHAVDAVNLEALRVFKNGKATAGFEKDGERVWTYLTFTLDVNGGTLYANGAKIHQRALPAEYTSLTDVELYLGVKLDESSFLPKLKKDDTPARIQGLCGYVDDVKLYNKALNDTEVSALYIETGAVGDVLPNSININIDDYKQQFVGVGGSTGLYLSNYSQMPRDKQLLASKMMAEEIPLKYIKHYVKGDPKEQTKMFTNFANFVRNARVYRPEAKAVLCVNNLPDHLEKQNNKGEPIDKEYDTTIPGIMDSIATYYFNCMKWFHDEGIEIEILDVINEEGLGDKKVRLFDEAVDKLEAILADPAQNPGGAIKRPLIMGPSCWSAASVTKWVDSFKENGNAWDNLDIVATHGYQNGSYNNYLKGYKAADGKPFVNSEQTGKIQDDEGTGANAIDPLARQFVSGEEPAYFGDISIAMRMTDFINAGGNAFYAFQLQNTKGNNAALLMTKSDGTVEKSQIYDGFYQISAIHPDSSYRVGRELNGLDDFKVLTMRQQGSGTVYAHATNLSGNQQDIAITLKDATGEKVKIKGLKVWVSDEFKDQEMVLEQSFDTLQDSVVFSATPHSVTSFEIVTEFGTTAIQENQALSSLDFYPNPTRSTLHFDKAAKREVYTLSGQLLLESDECIVNVSALQEGVYIIKMQNRAERFIKTN